MVDLAALRSAQPDLLDQAAGAWQLISTRLGGQTAAMRGEVMQPLFTTGDWTGMAAAAASASLTELSGQLSVTQEYAATMTSLLRDAADGVRDARSWLQAAENLAAPNALTIGADGSVSAALFPSLVGPGPASLSRLFQAPSPATGEVASLVSRALAVADDVDAQITARLHQLRSFAGTGAAGQLRAAGQLASAFDRAALPPTGTSPAEVNQWWNALNKSQQQKLISEFPARIGWMNGVPAEARNQANRIVMTTEKTQLTGDLATLEAHEPPHSLTDGWFGQVLSPAWAQWQGQVSRIQTELAGISALESGLAYAGSKAGASNVFLLGFDTSGNGQDIVAVGNPDTADNTVTYVPGTGSSLISAPGDIGRTTAMWQEAAKLAPGKTVSAVYWLGYNAPQVGLHDGLENLSIASAGAAVGGAPALTSFESGLQATHQAGVPDHTVVLGHSYGSLVVGEAAAHDGLKTNDIITIGSPGVGVDHAAQLGLSPSHVWSGDDAHDPVPLLPPLDPIAALTEPNATFYGINPASQAFGGQVFNATTDPAQSFVGVDFSAHSAYWDPGSASLRNIGHIVDAQYGSVSPGEPPPPNLGSVESLLHDVRDLL